MLLLELKSELNIVFQGLLTLNRDGSATVELESGRKLNYAIAPKGFVDVARLPGRPIPITFNARTQQGMAPFNVYAQRKNIGPRMAPNRPAQPGIF